MVDGTYVFQCNDIGMFPVSEQYLYLLLWVTLLIKSRLLNGNRSELDKISTHLRAVKKNSHFLTTVDKLFFTDRDILP